MISNQILQNTLDGLKNISRSDFCVAGYRGENLGVHRTESGNKQQ